MRLVGIAVCLVISGGSAAAQPGVCNVTIVRAPDDVRDVVETWVRAEPRCTGTLEVRIVPTDGGYYIFARDAAGRIRERVVPDPQSAGVLIASWAADDAPPAMAPPPRPMAPPSLVPAAPMQDPFVDAVPRRPRAYYWGGWLSVGYITSGDVNGVRAEADIVGRGQISTGVSLSLTQFDFGSDQATVTGRDVRAVVYGTDTLRQGSLSLRVGLGVGAMHTDSLVYVSPMFYQTSEWLPMGELSVEASLDLGSRWAVTAGAIGTVFEQSWPTGALPQDLGVINRYGDILALLGVRCRL